MSERDMELVRGSGNVFRDFRDPDADLKQAKAVIAARVIAVLDERELTVRGAARLTGFAVCASADAGLKHARPRQRFLSLAQC